jgi:biopolymer transport protein ExbB
MFELFLKGGPIMWPILILSIITFSIVLERCWFLILEKKNRDHDSVLNIFRLVEHKQLDEAARAGVKSQDMVARVLTSGLEHRHTSYSDAMLESANAELDRYNRGLVALDTAVTLGPLLGLLGTVVGMISAFGIVGGAELATQQKAITGGIAESLIAVTFGLGVAIVAIIPLNYLNSRLEKARRQMESAMTRLELLLRKCPECPATIEAKSPKTVS